MWFATLQEALEHGKTTGKTNLTFEEMNADNFWKSTDIVNAESFSDLMIKIGEKNWIDLLNKNPEDGR
jgi:hypothetical protein